MFWQNKKNSIFRPWFSILEIYWWLLLNFRHAYTWLILTVHNLIYKKNGFGFSCNVSLQSPPSPFHAISDPSSIPLKFFLMYAFSFPFFRGSISQFFRIPSFPFLTSSVLLFLFSSLYGISALFLSKSFCWCINNSRIREYPSWILPPFIQALVWPRGSWINEKWLAFSSATRSISSISRSSVFANCKAKNTLRLI